MIVKKISNHYGLLDKIYLAYCLIGTKIRFPYARLIRFPFHIRGKRLIQLGNHLTTGIHCRIEAFLTGDDKKIKIKFGDRVQLNDNVHISSLSSIEIGDDVLIASNVYISDNSHGSYRGDKYDSHPSIPPIKRDYSIASVKIGNRVWIGEGVMILPGTEIGDGAVIGAHSVVKGKVPENTIAVGAPIRIVKKFNDISDRWEKTTNQ